MTMNSKAVGELSEAVVMAHLIKLGRKVLLPFGNNQRYDIVTEDKGSFIRGQVKTGRYVNGCLVFNCASVNGFTGQRKVYTNEIDVFWIYAPFNGKVYEVPIAEARASQVTLRIDQPTIKQLVSVRWAKDYEI